MLDDHTINYLRYWLKGQYADSLQREKMFKAILEYCDNYGDESTELGWSELRDRVMQSGFYRM